jgi:hypothetical protein
MAQSLLRVGALLALSLSWLPAGAVEKCYSVAAPTAPAKNLPQPLPELVMLKDSLSRSLWAEPGDHEVDWIGKLDKERYGVRSYWRWTEGKLTVGLGDGFTGIRLSLDPSGNGFSGVALHYTDVPVPLPSYRVTLAPAACPGQGSNNSFKPNMLRSSKRRH